MNSVTRRRLLKLGSAGMLVGVAGCSGNTDDSAASSSATGTPRAELRNRISELKSRVEALQEQVSTKDQRIKSLQEEATAREQRVKSLQQDIASLESRIEQRNQTVESLEADLDAAETRIDELEAESGDFQYSDDVRQTATSAGRTLREAVVFLEFELGGGFGSGGTGWFIDENHIITNRHVVRDVAEGRTESETGYLLDGTEFSISVEATAEDDDVALLKADTTAPYVPPRGMASSLSAGQPLVQVGHPSLIGNWVIGLGEYIKQAEFSNAFLSEMPSKTGNSGSPVITLDGTVVGLTYGAVGRNTTGGPPEPSEEGALEEYPYQTSVYAEHEPIDVVEDYYQQWTRRALFRRLESPGRGVER